MWLNIWLWYHLYVELPRISMLCGNQWKHGDLPRKANGVCLMAEMSWRAMWLCLMGRQCLCGVTAIQGEVLLCGWDSVVRTTSVFNTDWIHRCETHRYKRPRIFIEKKNPCISGLVNCIHRVLQAEGTSGVWGSHRQLGTLVTAQYGKRQRMWISIMALLFTWILSLSEPQFYHFYYGDR